MSTFEALDAEAAAARLAYQEAQARYDAASLALLRAQCRQTVRTEPDSEGRNIQFQCLLERGHAGSCLTASEIKRLRAEQAVRGECPADPAPIAAPLLCSCGKPATHVNADEDSYDWACLVPSFDSAGRRLPPATIDDAAVEAAYRQAHPTFVPSSLAKNDRVHGAGGGGIVVGVREAGASITVAWDTMPGILQNVASGDLTLRARGLTK